MKSVNPSIRETAGAAHSGQPLVHDAGLQPCIEHLLKRVQEAHFQTLSTSPTILHWDSRSGDLSSWKWPVDLGTSRRITPSDLESHRRTHYFQAPSCLCAFLDSKPYSESRIAVVHLPIKLTKLSSLSGEYTAECAMGRCGYIVCLERFFVLPVLPMRHYLRRNIALSLEGLVYNSGAVGQASLLHAMPTDVVPSRAVKGLTVEEPWRNGPSAQKALAMMREGIAEDSFYSLFVRCYMCRAVVLKTSFPKGHCCPVISEYGYAGRGAQRHIHILSTTGKDFGIPTDIPTDVDTDIDAHSDTES